MFDVQIFKEDTKSTSNLYMYRFQGPLHYTSTNGVQFPTILPYVNIFMDVN